MNPVLEQTNTLAAIKDTCYHCGERNPEHPITQDNKYFCCEGCKMVFSILSENDLCNYYTLNETAGTSQRNVNIKAYAYLDQEEVITKLINFTDGQLSTVVFYIPQIHCSSCLWLLENLYKLNQGILSSRVNFLNREVKITYKNSSISLRQVVELLVSIGYAPYIQLNDLEEDTRPRTDKSLFYKLGLAGFTFGNIMLFSFPEYLGLSKSSDDSFSQFFSYLNLALILPVILYSGRDYFKSAIQGLKQKHLNIDVPVSLGILALFLRSVYEILLQIGPGYLDTLAGLIFFLLIGKWFQQATYARISFDRDYKSYFPIACTVRKGKIESQVTLDKLQKNDIVIIHHGELIPADGMLVEGEAKIDYSFVTGEAELIRKEKGELLYAGGRQMGANLEIVVTKKVSNSYLTELWNDHTFDKSTDQGKVNVLADKVASYFTWTILIIASTTLIFWMRIDAGMAINAFTSVLIIACPCAVALSIPFTFGNVIRIFSKNGIYFKNIQVIESLAKINHIVFDKTGTITNVSNQLVSYQGKALKEEELMLVYSLARQSNHPLSKQIADFHKLSSHLPVADFEEIQGKGIQGMVNSLKIRLGSASFINHSSNLKSDNGQTVYLEIDGIVKGFYSIDSHYRKGLKEGLQNLKEIGELSLISGDNDAERKALHSLFPASSPLFFNQKPVDKLKYLKLLRSQGLQVAMIGDGLNDAGALAESDVGVVVTENTSNFTPACDIIMDASKFEKLPSLFSFSKQSINLVYFAYGIALIYNVVGLTYAVQGVLSPVIAAVLMPLSSISIVLFGVGASRFLASRIGLA